MIFLYFGCYCVVKIDTDPHNIKSHCAVCIFSTPKFAHIHFLKNIKLKTEKIIRFLYASTPKSFSHTRTHMSEIFTQTHLLTNCHTQTHLRMWSECARTLTVCLLDWLQHKNCLFVFNFLFLSSLKTNYWWL